MKLRFHTKKIVFLSLFMSLSYAGIAQDTLRILQYNLFRYGETGKEPAFKNPLLKNIIDYTQPDLFGANEISGTTDYANNILNGALNVNGVTKWKRGKYSKAGNDKSLVNTLFYNSEKFELYDQDTVSVSEREITAYHLFYKDSNMSITKDTVFLTVIVCHLKAGNTSSDASRRSVETQQVANYLSQLTKPANIFFMGDFNIYKSSELAYQNLLNNNSPYGKLYDPINKPGTWNNNATFAAIHTQSTHSTQTGGFSSGGMDDRFDIILSSAYALNDSLRLRILPESYAALGNDGKHFNLAINAEPANTSVPSAVLGALYNMSDHVPVMTNFVITPAKPPVQGIDKKKNDLGQAIQVENPFNNSINLFFSSRLKYQDIHIALYAMTGQLIFKERIHHTQNVYQHKLELVNPLEDGMYILHFLTEDGLSITKKIMKQ